MNARARRAAGIASAILILAAAPAEADDNRSSLPMAVRPCAVCHGNNGVSPLAGVPNLAGQKTEYLVKQLTEMRASAEARLVGRAPTPSAPSHPHYQLEHRDNRVMDRQTAMLDNDTIRAIAEFFAARPRACAAPRPRGEVPRILARCAVCHGQDGIGLTAHVPNLAGQHDLYLADQIRRMRAAARGEVFIDAEITHASGIMGEQAIPLEENEIGALAVWFATAPCEAK